MSDETASGESKARAQARDRRRFERQAAELRSNLKRRKEKSKDQPPAGDAEGAAPMVPPDPRVAETD